MGGPGENGKWMPKVDWGLNLGHLIVAGSIVLAFGMNYQAVLSQIEITNERVASVNQTLLGQIGYNTERVRRLEQDVQNDVAEIKAMVRELWSREYERRYQENEPKNRSGAPFLRDPTDVQNYGLKKAQDDPKTVTK